MLVIFMEADIKTIGLGLFLKKEKTLIISDLHIGIEEELIKKGILIPRTHSDQIMKELKYIFSKVRPKKVIINGDLKHEFGRISREEWKQTRKVLNFILEKLGSQNLILVKGNHDTILKPIIKDLKLVDYYKTGDYFICHGHKLFRNNDFKKSKTIIIGHDHAAIFLRDTAKQEKFKAFFSGTWKKKKMILMPSMNALYEGTAILDEPTLSPFLKEFKAKEVFVLGNHKVFSFKVKKIKN